MDNFVHAIMILLVKSNIIYNF